MDDVSLDRIRHATVILPKGADWVKETEKARLSDAGVPVAWEMKPMHEAAVAPAVEVGGAGG